MPLPLQSKLLRVLQEKEFEPVGSNEMLHSDVRVIAATSMDLEAAIKRGEFRADLYYRLNVLPIQVPPLRERLEDIPALSEAILEELRSQHELDRDALALLAQHAWPGNIRELRNVLERAALLSDDLVLNATDIRASIGTFSPVERGAVASAAAPVYSQQISQQASAALPDEKQTVRSPISGVFYLAKEPGAAPFVQAGSKVNKGDTLCIIEAMKTMNEIRAPKNCVIAGILAADGATISAGDPLFLLDEGN